jgi:hypothetical protein
MTCSECRDLYRTFERRTNQYLEARSSAFFQISPQIATRKQVSLLRALSDLREHQEECPWALAAEHIAQRRTLLHSVVQ